MEEEKLVVQGDMEFSQAQLGKEVGTRYRYDDDDDDDISHG